MKLTVKLLDPEIRTLDEHAIVWDNVREILVLNGVLIVAWVDAHGFVVNSHPIKSTRTPSGDVFYQFQGRVFRDLKIEAQ